MNLKSRLTSIQDTKLAVKLADVTLATVDVVKEKVPAIVERQLDVREGKAEMKRRQSNMFADMGHAVREEKKSAKNTNDSEEES